MATMRAADVLRLIASFEPSRAKLWEMARTYDPVDFARLVYLIGNVSRAAIVGTDGVRRPRTSASLPEYDMADPVAAYCCECTCENPTEYDPYGCGGSVRFVLSVEPWTDADVIRLGRSQYRDRRLWLQGQDKKRLPSRYPRFGMETSAPRCIHCNRPRLDPWAAADGDDDSAASSSGAADAGIDDRLEAVLEAVMRHSSESPAARNAVDSLVMSDEEDDNKRRLAVALVQHNVATDDCWKLIDHVKHLLLPASYRPPRNTTGRMGIQRQKMIRGQVEVQYLRFYNAVRHGRWTFEAEPHAMSAVLLPPMGRFYDANHLTDLRDATRDVVADFPTDGTDTTGIPDPFTETTTTTTTTTNVLMAGRIVVVGDGGITGPSSDTRDQTLARYLVQPLYQGVRLVVYASPRDTRCYTRHGELYPNLAYKKTRTTVPCVFEAVLLPVDESGAVRSWRFWSYRADYALHVVDVFRYGSQLLVELPFADRVPFIAKVVAAGDSSTRLRAVPAELTNAVVADDGTFVSTSAQTWARIGEAYERHRDVFEPIAGVVLRDTRHRLVLPATTPSTTTTTTNIPSLGRPPVAYHFPVRFGYDLLEDRVLDLAASESAGEIRAALATYQRLQVACDLADYRTVCAMYAHSDTRLHLCRYNRRLQQFVHAASIVRQPCDGIDQIRYRADFVYVLHAVTPPLGLFYLRVYYDRLGAIRGYDYKTSDSRYKVALAWDPLLLARAVAVPQLVEPFPKYEHSPPRASEQTNDSAEME